MTSTTDSCRRPVDICHISSPCTYWVKNIPITAEDRASLLWTEYLNSHCNKVHTSRIKKQLDIQKDDLVAVLNKDGKQWYRGQVQHFYQTSAKFMYKVFLIDRGKNVEVESRNVLPLSENFISIPRLAYQIGIFGIFPKSEEKNHRCEKDCKCPTQYVHRLLKKYAIEFERILEINGVLFGHVYLDCDEEGFINLANKLCEEDLVVKSKQFSKDVLKYFANIGRNVCDTNTANHDSSTESSFSERSTGRRSINSESDFSEDGFQFEEVTHNKTIVLKQYEKQRVQCLLPAGMPIPQTNSKKDIISKRMCKMNNMLERVAKRNYYDRNKSNKITSNSIDNSLRGDVQKSVNNDMEQKNKSNDSIELNDGTETNISHSRIKNNSEHITSDPTYNQLFKNKPSSNNLNATPVVNTSRFVVNKNVPRQINMSQFIQKVCKLKSKTECTEDDNVRKERTDIDQVTSLQKTNCFENDLCKPKEIISGINDSDHFGNLNEKTTVVEVVSTKEAKANYKREQKDVIKTDESNNNKKQIELKHKNVAFINKIKRISSTSLKSIETVNSENDHRSINLKEDNIKSNHLLENGEKHTITDFQTPKSVRKNLDKIQGKNLTVPDKLKRLYLHPTVSCTVENTSEINSSASGSSLIKDDGLNISVSDSLHDIENSETEFSSSLTNSSEENPTQSSSLQLKSLNLLEKIKHLNLFKSLDKSENGYNQDKQMSSSVLDNAKIVASEKHDIEKDQLMKESVDSLDVKNENYKKKYLVTDSKVTDIKKDQFTEKTVDVSNLSEAVETKVRQQNEQSVEKNVDVSNLSEAMETKVRQQNEQSVEKTVDVSNLSEAEVIEVNQQGERAVDVSNLSEAVKTKVKQQNEKLMETNVDVFNLSEAVETNVLQGNEQTDCNVITDSPVGEEKSKRLSLPEKLKLLKHSRSNISIGTSTPKSNVSFRSSTPITSPNNNLNSSSMTNNSVNLVSLNENFLSVTSQMDSHISFKSKNSQDQSDLPKSLNSTRGSDISFENRNSSNISGYFDFVRNGSVLIHGKDTYKPVKTFYEADFDEVIFKNLETCGLRDLARIQKYAFPVIMDRRNTVMVSSRRTGKSIAYIVPLLCLLRQVQYYEKLHQGNGPRAVIIVAGWKSAKQIFDMCSKLIGYTGDLNVQIAYKGANDLEMKANLTNGCDLLISTPRCFLRLLEEKYVTNINRLCHIVLDETDILFQTFMPEVQKLLKLVKQMLNVRKSSGINFSVQVIVLSHAWTPPLEELSLTVLQDPVICIASYLEAAVYAKVKPSAVFLKPENKIAKLFELLELKPRKQKTVVICSQQDLEEIETAAKNKNVEILSAHQGMAPFHCADIQKLWTSKPASHEPILVCTDQVLDEMAVTDAQILIHYSLPSNKSSFSFRFGCLLDAYSNIFDQDDQSSCQIYIFVDGDNEIQLPEVIWFLERTGIKVPSSLEVTVNKILKQREENKDTQFCKNMKQFGFCWDQHKCSSRHILKKEDISQDIPQSGQIKVVILHIHNACHYSVRILEHFDGEVWTKLPQFYLQIVMEINNYYNNVESRRLHGFPSVGDIAGFEISGNSYQRVKIMKITKFNEKNDPSSVLVRLIDQGFEEECQVMELYMLPEKLRAYPAQAVDVYLCRMLPVDLDRTWNDSIRNTVAYWIKSLSEKHEDSYFVGKIALSLGTSIWLDPLECVQWLALSDTSAELMCLRKRLLEKNFAVDNPDHLFSLYKLCEEANISYLPKLEIKKSETKTDESRITPQWAHLPRDEYTLVNLIQIPSFDKIYLRIVGFQDRLEILSRDIEADITNNNNNTIPSGILKVGDICLGRFPDDNKWYRAMVLNKSDKNLKLFYVDHGDIEDVSWEEVKKIQPEFVTRLPFQIIECYLAGVEPMDGQNWEESAIDFLFDITESNGINKDIFVKVCEIDLKAKTTGGRRYKVILVDTTGPNDVVINQVLLVQGFAKCKAEEENLFENISIDEKTERERDNEIKDSVSIGTEHQVEEKDAANIASYCSVPGVLNNRFLPKEESDRLIEQLLTDLESDRFEYVSPNLAYNENFVKPKTNKVVIKEIFDNESDSTANNSTQAELVSKNTTKNSEQPSSNFPDLVNNGKCPNLTWHQNDQYVWIRFILTGVQQYRLVWQVRNIQFSTMHQNMFYFSNLNLYGGMEPDHLFHFTSGFYVEIKFKKAVKGFAWPRLIQGKNKLPWIKTNLEHYNEVEHTSLDEEISNWKSYNPNHILDNDDQSSSTKSSEIHEPDTVPYDPYDPFS